MRKAALLAPLALVSCAASLGDPRETALPGGFSLLEMPRTEVPLGSVWMQGYGPTGESAAAENVASESGLTALTSTVEKQRNAGFRAAPILVIAPSSKSRSALSFSEVTIHRVKKLTSLGFRPGESRISEAIRAGRLSMQVEQGSRREASAGVRQAPVNLSGEIGRQDQANIGLEGNNLFVAYKVVTAEPRKRTEEKMRLVREGSGWKGIAGGLEATIAAPSGCGCDGAEGPCPRSWSVTLKEKVGDPASAAEQRVTLTPGRQLIDLPATNERPAPGGALLDLTQLKAELRPLRGAAEACQAEPPKLSLVRTTVQLRPLDEPEAPGW